MLRPEKALFACSRLAWLLVAALLAAVPAMAAPSKQAQGVPVLVYHELVTDGKAPGVTVMAMTDFARQMQYLDEQGYHTVSMADLVAYMARGRRLPEKPVVLTFDDGWLSQLQAVPVLHAHGFRATFWIITGQRGIGWPYMQWSDIQQLSRDPKFAVEAHTASHPWNPTDNLVTWTNGQNRGKGLHDAWLEIVQSRQELQGHIHLPVKYLAWPCGWYDARLVSMARQAGYSALMTIDPGLNRRGDNVLAVKRTEIDGRCGKAEFAATLHDGIMRMCGGASPPTATSPPALR